MQKVLFCVDSYLQLIISISLRLEIYSNWDADIVIYNTTPSAKKIYDFLKEKKVFYNTFFADSMLAKVGDNYSLIEKFPKYFVYIYSIFMPKNSCRKILNNCLVQQYDQLIFHGHGAIAECIFNTCYQLNNKLRCYRIDDGLGTYLSEWGVEKWKTRIVLEKILYFLCNYKHIENFIDGYYVAEPRMMAFKAPYPVFKLPNLNKKDKKYVSLLNSIFGYTKKEYFERKKIIFFGTWGRGVAGDIELIKVIKEVIPVEEILIKVHPRESQEKYKDVEIDLMDQSEVPWEIVMLNHDFSKCIFVTAESSAVFTSRVYFRTTGADVYAYKCFNGKYYDLPKSIEKWVDLYRKVYIKKCLFVPHSIENFKKVLSEIL